MNTAGSYAFKMVNPKAARYLLLCLAGLPFLFLLIVWQDMPFIILMAIIFLPIIAGFVLVVKKEKIAESIFIEKDHLLSDYYGRIDFENIVSVGRGSLQITSLKLTLQSGKKIVWNGVSKVENNPDVTELKRFIDGLSTAIKGLSASDAAWGEKEEQEGASSDTSEKHSELPSAPASTDWNELNQELKETQSQKSKAGKLAIPASAIVLLVVLFQWLGPKITKQRNEASLRPFREAIRHQNQEQQTLKDSAQEVVDTYYANHGPYYLLSNDTTATLKYLPQPAKGTGRTNRMTGSSVKLLFDDGSKSDYYKMVLHHPDSLNWCICLQTARKPYLLKKHRFDSDENIKTYLYVAVINLSEYLAVPSSNPYDHTQKPDSVPIEIEKAIPLDSTLSPEKNIKKGLRMFKRIIMKYPDSSKFYLTARRGEGRMNKQLFAKAALAFKKELTQMKVDTTQFTFNEF